MSCQFRATEKTDRKTTLSSLHAFPLDMDNKELSPRAEVLDIVSVETGDPQENLMIILRYKLLIVKVG